MTQQEQDFIQNNLKTDVNHLILNPPAQHRNRIKFLAEQIRSRQKAVGKLPGWLGNPALIFPAPLSVEQSSSELCAKYKADLVSGTELIDLSGGMGIDCMEMQRNFSNATYIERNPELCELAQHNSQTFGINLKVLNRSSEEVIAELAPQKERVIFVDPDRRADAKKLVRFSDCSPDISELQRKLKDKCDQLLIKASPILDIKSGINELENVKEVHVLSVRNECKEVLFLIDYTLDPTSTPMVVTVNLHPQGNQNFEFDYDSEEQSPVRFGDCQSVVLIPNSSILKAGAFRILTDRFPISKLAPSTHLYTTEEVVSDFPGRQFRVLVSRVTKDEIKSLLPNKKANVITRNHPQAPAEIRKKFKLKEGGDKYIIAFRDKSGKGAMILAELV